MGDFCGYCYARPEVDMALSVCGNCKHRKYCSRKCQVADWKCGHKHWCGRAGEIGFDYEIREAGEKGLGVFALRHFERGEKVMAERGFALSKVHEFTPSVISAIQDLVPRYSNDMQLKYQMNAIGTGDCFPASEHHIFINMSRVNHHCIGNTDHFYIEPHKVAILTAICTIEPDDEVTFSYIDFMMNAEMYEHMDDVWKFQCSCSACTTSAVRSKLFSLHDLDSQVLRMGMLQRFDEAVASGKELLAIYEELHLSFISIHRTHYDLFQVTVTRKRNLKQARTYIQQALNFAVLMYGDINMPEVQRLRRLVADPTQHRN